MNRPRWFVAFVFCLAGACVTSSGVRAETVFIRHGLTTGNGWLFVDRDGHCRLVTPAHVVQPAYPQGPLVDALLIDKQGRTLEAGRGAVPDPDLDLAFLEVKPYGQPSLCTRSRLGGPTVSQAIDRMRDGDLEIMGEGGLQRETVERISRSRADLASTITVRPRNSAFQLLEGYSGSIVLVGESPAAMVTNVVSEANVAIALRFDEIARLAPASAPVPKTPGADDHAIIATVALVGVTLDTARPPSSASSASGWLVEPENGRIAFEMTTDGKPVADLGFSTAGLEEGKAIIEHRRADSDSYAYVAPCYIRATRANCSLGAKSFEFLRVTIPTRSAVAISNLTLAR